MIYESANRRTPTRDNPALGGRVRARQIYLFGSHAWGQPHEDSDVDLLIIVPESSQSPLERGLAARRCLRDLRVPKDILVQTQAEVDRASQVYASLESEILEKGVRLYG